MFRSIFHLIPHCLYNIIYVYIYTHIAIYPYFEHNCYSSRITSVIRHLVPYNSGLSGPSFHEVWPSPRRLGRSLRAAAAQAVPCFGRTPGWKGVYGSGEYCSEGCGWTTWVSLGLILQGQDDFKLPHSRARASADQTVTPQNPPSGPDRDTSNAPSADQILKPPLQRSGR